MQKKIIILVLAAACAALFAGCASGAKGGDEKAELPNPASVFCKEQGGRLELRADETGAVQGVCVFTDGSECEEWAYFRGECGPGSFSDETDQPAEGSEPPAVLPADPAETAGWQTYRNAFYGFSVMIPADWIVEEASDELLGGHMAMLRPAGSGEDGMSIRMTFRRAGEEVLLWPTGVGEGEFVESGTLNVGGQAARRLLFICPNGDTGGIWYHGANEDGANLQIGGLEFGFITSPGGTHCEPGRSLNSESQHLSDLVVGSLKVD